MISWAADFRIDLTARIHVDASDALGILERRGVGRVDVGALWLQEQSLRRAVEFMKAKGTSNPADLMTKHLAREQVEQYAEALNLDCRKGHAATAVKLHSTQKRRTHDEHDAKPNTDDRDNNHDTDYNSYYDAPAAAGQTSAPGALSRSELEPRRRRGWQVGEDPVEERLLQGDKRRSERRVA